MTQVSYRLSAVNYMLFARQGYEYPLMAIRIRAICSAVDTPWQKRLELQIIAG